MREDIGSYKVNNFASEYFVNINQLIRMTIQQAQGDPAKAEDTLCILWICKNELNDIRIIQGVKNKDNKPLLTSLDDLIGVVKNGFNDLVDTERAKISPENNKDSTDLVIYRAFLHTNMKKYNPYYGFDSVVANMLDLYGRTKIHAIKDTIAGELKKIKHNDGNFGSHGDKIKDFPKSLRTILDEK
jgi:hypothetical protein